MKDTRLAWTPIAALAVGLFAGCARLPAPAVNQISQARSQVESGQYGPAERLLTPVINQYIEYPQVAEAFYLRGQCRLKAGRREDARSDFNKGLVLADDRALQVWLEVQAANMAFDDDRYERARFLYELAIDDVPSGPPADRVLFQYGVCLQRTQNFREARDVFERVFREYPASSFATAARRKYNWDDEYFSVQCGVFSTKTRAQQMASDLRRKGIGALAVAEGGGGRYVVRAGQYQTYAEAARMLDRVRSHQPDAFIVP